MVTAYRSSAKKNPVNYVEVVEKQESVTRDIMKSYRLELRIFFKLDNSL